MALCLLRLRRVQIRAVRTTVVTVQSLLYSQTSKDISPGTNDMVGLDKKYILPQRDPNEWQSSFALFNRGGSTALELRLFLNQLDFSVKGFKKLWDTIQEEKYVANQSFVRRRFEILGPDLAAAHFSVFRDGKVKFKGQDQWITKGDDEFELGLPKFYDAGYILEHLDLSNTGIIYEGLGNLVHLENLKSLKLHNCKFVDDWCLDRISGEYWNSLEELDISNCDLITERGLSSLSRLKKLRRLHISCYPKAQSLELVCLLLEETIPGLEITGFKYCDEQLLETMVKNSSVDDSQS